MQREKKSFIIINGPLAVAEFVLSLQIRRVSKVTQSFTANTFTYRFSPDAGTRK